VGADGRVVEDVRGQGVSEMTEYMTDEVLQSLEVDIISNLRGGGSMNLMNAVSALIAQARQAPDPAALPLSTAMREARRWTGAGVETWVYARTETEIGLLETLYRPGPSFMWSAFTRWDRPDFPKGWEGIGHNHVAIRAVELAICKLVTPEEGAALLRGEG